MTILHKIYFEILKTLFSLEYKIIMVLYEWGKFVDTGINLRANTQM
jgi:hypothetical protein